MRYFYLFILVLLANTYLSFAQTNRSIRVKAGEDIAQAYSPQGFYRFPQFSKANLFFKGGGKNTGALFNYNILSGNMQFINPAGDTLDMVNPSEIESVVFEKNIFYYKYGFMEVVAQADSLKLLKKTIIKTQTENIGAYGQPNSTAAIDNIKTISSRTGYYSFILNQDVVVSENVTWFWMYGNNNPVKATRTNLLKSVSIEKQNAIEAYLKQTRINFNEESDLKKLLAAGAK